MQGFVFSVLRVLFGILDSAQIGFGVSGVFWGVFLRGEGDARIEEKEVLIGEWALGV